LKRTVRVTLVATCLVQSGCFQPSVDPTNVTPAGTTSCAFVAGTGAGARTLFCVETTGENVAQAQGDQGVCVGEADPQDASAGTWTFAFDAGCPRQGTVGGCRTSDTSGSETITVTQWFYDGGIDLRSAPDGAGIPSCAGEFESP
jgi:hypothetical protein